MTSDKQLMWDTLKGIHHPLVKEYYQKDTSKFNKYMKIQKALNNPKVSFTPVQATRKGPGGEHANWKKGLEMLAKHLPVRRTTIPKSIIEIEKEMQKLGYKRIKWGKMSWAFRPVKTRYGKDIGLGADILIEGVAKGGLRVCYYYDNSASAEGAHRYVLIGKKKANFRSSEIKNTLAKVLEK